MEQCIHCYQDSRLGLLLGPYVRQNFPWDNPPHCYNPLHLKYSRNYRPKECYHPPKANFKVMRLARFSMDYLAKSQIDANVQPRYPIQTCNSSPKMKRNQTLMKTFKPVTLYKLVVPNYCRPTILNNIPQRYSLIEDYNPTPPVYSRKQNPPPFILILALF